MTPGVLNRVITLLRQALGESAHETQYLHTLHGVGYRFDAQVQFEAQRPRAEASAAPADVETAPVEMPASNVASADTAAIALRDDASIQPIAVEPDAVPVAHAGAAIAPPIMPAAATPVARRSAWPWKSIAMFAALAALAGFWTVYKSTDRPAPANLSLVVLPLHAVGNAANEGVLAEGLSEELTTRLARIEGLSLISQTSAALAQERKLDFEQLAKQLHVNHAIEGSLRQAGDQLRIDLRLVELPSGRTVWVQDYDRKLADVFAIQREVAQAVAGALALRLGLAGSADANVDIALYREYLELRGILLKPDFATGTPRLNEARDALRSLVARVPDYARAHGLLARTLSARDGVLGEQTSDHLAEAEREAERALQLDADNVDAHAVKAQLAHYLLDWETSNAEYRRVQALDPTDILARVNYAWSLGGLGYVSAALDGAETAHRADPLNIAAAITYARMLDTAGKHDEANRAFGAAIPLDQGLPQYVIYGRWHNAAWRRDYAQAAQLAARMPETEGFREAYIAISAALADPTLWPQAMPAIAESERRTGKYNFGRLFAPGYDAQQVFAVFETMLRNAFPSYFVLPWQPEYAELRRTPAFQNYIKRTHILDYWRAHDFPPRCKPDGDGARCE